MDAWAEQSYLSGRNTQVHARVFIQDSTCPKVQCNMENSEQNWLLTILLLIPEKLKQLAPRECGCETHRVWQRLRCGPDTGCPFMMLQKL